MTHRLCGSTTLGLAVLLVLATMVSAQTATPPKPPAQPQAPAPAQAAPAAPVRSAPRVVSTTLAVQVTDNLGTVLPDVHVTAVGPVSREGATGTDGFVRFSTMRVGGYRLRFERGDFTILERDITLRAGETPIVDIALNPAPPPPKLPEAPSPPPPAPAPKALPPPGEVKVVDIPAFLDRNLIGGRDGRKDSPLGCAATGTATLHQLRETWANDSHPEADEWLYVVAGQGTLRVGSTEQRLQAGTFSLIPHTVEHAVVSTSRNPLIVVSILSGPACVAP
jgi:mannose-6-phosphate isomerase-like protein (cupin superfamily)